MFGYLASKCVELGAFGHVEWYCYSADDWEAGTPPLLPLPCARAVHDWWNDYATERAGIHCSTDANT